MKNIFILLCLLIGNQAFTQTSLSGKVTDEETGEPILFGSVALYKGGNLETGVETDLEGFYNFANIDPGTYDVEVTYVGYSSQRINGIVVYAGQSNKLDIKLGNGIDLEEVVVVDYKVPLISHDMTTSGAIISMGRERSSYSSPRKRKKRKKKKKGKLGKLPTRNIGSIAANSAGVKSSNKDSRSASQFYMVDGIRAQGNLIPEKAKKEETLLKKPRTSSEEYTQITENQFITTKKENTSTFSIDVDKASYSMIRRFLKQDHALPPPNAVRIEEMINYFNYDYENPTGEEPFSLYSATAQCPWKQDDLLLHVGIKGKEVDMKNSAPNNLVFLIDVSGSMTAANKLDLIKPAFEYLVKNLRPQDRVAIVTYAGRSALVLPSTAADQPVKIMKAIKNLTSGGSTAGAQGIKLAYKTAMDNFIEGGNNRVILATDGDFNVGISSSEDLEKLIEEKRKTGVYLTTLGFGRGNYKDNRMEKLADKGNGNYSYIDNLNEAKKVFVSDLTGTLYTIAKDVKIQIEFDSTFVESYRLIGYENRLLANEDFHNDTKDAGELGAGHTVTALYQLKLKSPSPEEILKLKLRYKMPDEDQSRYIESYTTGDGVSFKKAPENLRFASSVAGFGMLLRGSEFKGNLNYAMVKKMAKNAKGSDSFGLRKEFLELVEIVKRSESIASK